MNDARPHVALVARAAARYLAGRAGVRAGAGEVCRRLCGSPTAVRGADGCAG